MWLELGRVTISGEWCDPWHWRPFAECYFERDPYMQDWSNCIWYGGFGWLKWWIQITVSKSRGRYWWQGR